MKEMWRVGKMPKERPDKAAAARRKPEEKLAGIILAGYGIYIVAQGRSVSEAVVEVLLMDAGSRLRVAGKRRRSLTTTGKSAAKEAALCRIPRKSETKPLNHCIISRKPLWKIIKAAVRRI